MRDIKFQDDWQMITYYIANALNAEKYRTLRSRFNTERSEDERSEEDLRLQKVAAENWFTAKAIYCNNKDYYDSLYLCHKGEDKVNDDNFIAMKRVIEKEMTACLENQILKEGK